jgi:hypothetical protein
MICDRRQKVREKKHKNNGSMLSFSCLKGVKIRGGKKEDDHRSSSSSIFRKSIKDQGIKT